MEREIGCLKQPLEGHLQACGPGRPRPAITPLIALSFFLFNPYIAVRLRGKSQPYEPKVINHLKSRLKGVLPPRLEQGIRRLLLRRHIGAFPKRIVEHTYLGHPLKISIQDDLAEEWYDNLYASESMPEIEFLQRGRLKTGARVFDLGAHQAVVAMILARVVGDSGSVIAVEGTRYNACLLYTSRCV